MYLDYASTTPLDSHVKKEMEKNLKFFGNPSSIHIVGEDASKSLEDSRSIIADILKVKKEEIYFTASGTESINMAILGVARANKKKGNHIITTSIEHSAILDSCKKLKEEGFKITYIKPNKDGIIDPQDIKKAIRKNTILISVAYANNEIGTIQPIRKISNIIPKRIYFHSDACQATRVLNTKPNDLKVDLLSLDASKVYGPKGVGLLHKNRKVKMEPIIFGSLQERGLRAGTENISGIAGFAKALEIAEIRRKKDNTREAKLRDYCIDEILKKIPNSMLNGHKEKRLPNNINISFKNIDGEMLMMYLSNKGFCVSVGAACTASEGTSHVIRAIKNPREWGNIRVTIGRETKREDINNFIKVLKFSVKKIRSL